MKKALSNLLRISVPFALAMMLSGCYFGAGWAWDRHYPAESVVYYDGPAYYRDSLFVHYATPSFYVGHYITRPWSWYGGIIYLDRHSRPKHRRYYVPPHSRPRPPHYAPGRPSSRPPHMAPGRPGSRPPHVAPGRPDRPRPDHVAPGRPGRPGLPDRPDRPDRPNPGHVTRPSRPDSGPGSGSNVNRPDRPHNKPGSGGQIQRPSPNRQRFERNNPGRSSVRERDAAPRVESGKGPGRPERGGRVERPQMPRQSRPDSAVRSGSSGTPRVERSPAPKGGSGTRIERPSPPPASRPGGDFSGGRPSGFGGGRGHRR